MSDHQTLDPKESDSAMAVESAIELARRQRATLDDRTREQARRRENTRVRLQKARKALWPTLKTLVLTWFMGGIAGCAGFWTFSATGCVLHISSHPNSTLAEAEKASMDGPGKVGLILGFIIGGGAVVITRIEDIRGALRGID